MSAPKFIGTYERSLDAKGRLILPVRLRFGPNGFLTPHFDGCLALWTPEAFDQKFDEYLERQERSASDRQMARWWSSGSQPVEIDKQGRLPITGPHLEYAELEGSVVVVGALNRVELWRPERWGRIVSPSQQAMFRAEEEGPGPGAPPVPVSAGAPTG